MPEPTQVTAAYITPGCRVNRTADGAWDEAVARLRAEYDAIVAGWANAPAQPTVVLSLSVVRPDA